MRVLRNVVLALTALFVLGGSAVAGEVFLEDYAAAPPSGEVLGRPATLAEDGVLAHTEGDPRPGGYRYPASRFAGLDGGRGSIEFWVRWLQDDEPHSFDPILTFVEATGRTRLLIAVDWGDKPGYAAGIAFMDNSNDMPRYDVWGNTVYMQRAPRVGEWRHVVLTWGTKDADHRVYFDGVEAVSFDPPRGHDGGRLDLSLVTHLLVGTDAYWDPNQNHGWWFADDTLIGGVALYDHVMGRDEVASTFARRALTSSPPVYPPDVAAVQAEYRDGAVVLSWNPVTAASGYRVYRRMAQPGARFERLNEAPLLLTKYQDATVQPHASYRYSVYAISGDGLESRDAVEVEVTAAVLSVAGVAAEAPLYGADQQVVVTLRGSADAVALFGIEGVGSGFAMTEVDDGVYVGRVAVPAGLNASGLALTGTLTDATSGQTASATGPAIAIDTTAPQAVPAGRILDPAVYPGELELSWAASPSADVAAYRIYRGEGAAPQATGAAYGSSRELSYVDTAVLGGIDYHYTVVAVDAAGNVSGPSETVHAVAEAGAGPKVSAITIEPFGRPAKPGTELSIRVAGQSGATAGVALGELASLDLAEEGRSGTYRATYVVPETAVAATQSRHRLVVTLTDAYGGSRQAGPELAIIGRDALNDTTAPAVSGVAHNAARVAGASGALVAGDTLTVSLTGEPHGYASFAIAGVSDGVPMTETEAGSGTYRGSYTVGWDAEGRNVEVTATLADEAGNATTLAAGEPVHFDTRVRLSVSAREALLPADAESQTRLVVKAEDANGEAVSGHELSLALSTTEEYTGVVGGGDVEGQKASKDDADDLEVKWGGTTDRFGEVAATYTAGFAAKTALIVVKDLTTGDVGAGWLNTYVASTVSITLTPSAARAARGLADQAVLTLTADPAKLTADGRSRSRLTATLKSLTGSPIEGAPIEFILAGDNGRLRRLDSRTDANGEAQAEYRAGTLAGTVTITAVAEDHAVTASVPIVLMSDAPAKIDLVASATTLPADGASTAEIALRVSDIHDNPNSQVPVTLAVVEGSGRLNQSELFTDRNGEGAATFTAGRRAGQAVIEARHTSRAPSEEELRRIYGTVFVPRLMDKQERERIQVALWLVEPKDEVVKGQPLVILESRSGSWTLTAPENGVFVREVRHRRDRVELGDTLGYIEIDMEVWEEEYSG